MLTDPPLDLLVVGSLTIDRFADGSLAPGGSVLHATRSAVDQAVGVLGTAWGGRDYESFRGHWRSSSPSASRRTSGRKPQARTISVTPCAASHSIA